MYKIILILTAIVFYSCSNNSYDNNYQLKIPTKLQQESVLIKDSIDFKINTFTDIPSEIDGCGCYFYLSKEDEQDKKYLLVNDFASIAFLSINGKVVKFVLKEHKENSSFYLYSNGFYKLSVEITKKEDGGIESSIIKGLIKLSKGNIVIEKKFVGFCGC